jgi:monofunctional biosynthetic peptidoglycan transglycosylase
MRFFSKYRVKSKRARRSRLARFVRWTVLVLASLYAFCALVLVALRWVNPPFTAVQVQRRVESYFSTRKYQKRQTFVPLKTLPRDLQHAVIAAEDGRFYEHAGIDWQELQKVAKESLPEGRMARGASTISQQLAKNLFLTTHRLAIRKALEYALVPLVELTLPKKRILELYLNVIEWGPGVYGVEAASRYHYGISAAKLNRDQAARLAACIPSPRLRKPERMSTYSAIILDRMQKRGW